MTDLAEIGRAVGEIADGASNSWEAMSECELFDVAGGMGMAMVQASADLLQRCGGDLERTRMHIARAMELPAPVLIRRSNECREIIARDDQPNIPQQAAWIAVMVKQMHVISELVERKRTLLN